MEPVPMQILPSSKGGFTLIEVLVAVLILMVGLLGLLQASNVAMDQNVKDMFRTEAVRIADARMSRMKALPYANITANTTIPVKSSLRGLTKTYPMTTAVAPLAGSLNSKVVTVTVSWTHKNVTRSHEIRTVCTQ